MSEAERCNDYGTRSPNVDKIPISPLWSLTVGQEEEEEEEEEEEKKEKETEKETEKEKENE